MTRARTFDEDMHCGALTRQGTPCMRSKGAGTDHPGSGNCSKHGGCTRAGIVHAAREEADAIASEITLLSGVGAAITPGEGLLTMVNRSWAQVLFFEQQVAKLQLDDAVGRPIVTKITPGASLVIGLDADGSVDGIGGASTIEETHKEVRLNIWAAELQRAMDRCAKYSKMALDAGVAQQQIDMARGQAASWAPMLKHVVEGLQLSAEQMALLPALLRSALQQSTLEIA